MPERMSNRGAQLRLVAWAGSIVHHNLKRDPPISLPSLVVRSRVFLCLEAVKLILSAINALSFRYFRLLIPEFTLFISEIYDTMTA